MKKTIITFIASIVLIVFVNQAFAQVPQGFNYQAVARNSTGVLIANQALGVKLSIHQDTANGTVVYSERQTPTSNQFGLFTVTVGKGSMISGNFNTINWSSGKYWLEVGLDVNGASSYTPMGTSKLLSVPYAMYAGSTASLPIGTSGQTLRNDGTNWVNSSLIYNDGNRVGIANTTPSALLQMGGSVSNGARSLTFMPDLGGNAIYGPAIGMAAIANTNASPPTVTTLVDAGDTYNGGVIIAGHTQSGITSLNFQVIPLSGTGPQTVNYSPQLTLEANALTLNGKFHVIANSNNTSYSDVSALIENANTLNDYAGLSLNVAGHGGTTIFGTYGSGLNVGDNSNLGFCPVNASAFNVTSDLTMKKDIEYLSNNDFADCLNQIRDIKSIRFRYLSESNTEGDVTKFYRPYLHIGVSAQSLPKEVSVKMDNDPSGKTKGEHLGMSLSDMSGLMLAGIKALDVQQQKTDEIVKAQQKQIDELKAEVNQLKALLQTK